MRGEWAYQHENNGDRALKLCLKYCSLSRRSRDEVELWRWMWCTWLTWWLWWWCGRMWCLSCFSLVSSTVTHGIWTSCSGVLLSLSACTKFRIFLWLRKKFVFRIFYPNKRMICIKGGFSRLNFFLQILIALDELIQIMYFEFH